MKPQRGCSIQPKVGSAAITLGPRLAIPSTLGVNYWPKGVAREATISAFVEAYETLGYVGCETADAEPGFEKIAIFTKPAGTPTHAARQLPNGKWTSKLGNGHDIEHDLRGVEGREYGDAKVL